MKIEAPTVEEIYEHVKELGDGNIAGVCGQPDRCIIASYLMAKYPDYDFLVKVGERKIEYKRKGDDWPIYSDERKFLPMSESLWRMARGFDQLERPDYAFGLGHTEIMASDAAIYLHGFLRATRETWN